MEITDEYKIAKQLFPAESGAIAIELWNYLKTLDGFNQLNPKTYIAVVNQKVVFLEKKPTVDLRPPEKTQHSFYNRFLKSNWQYAIYEDKPAVIPKKEMLCLKPIAIGFHNITYYLTLGYYAKTDTLYCQEVRRMQDHYEYCKRR